MHRFRAETGGPSHPMAWQSHDGNRRIPGHEAERIQKSRTWFFRTYTQSRFLASTYAQSRFLAAGARRERAVALRLERAAALRPPSETATPLSHTSKSRSRRPDRGSASGREPRSAPALLSLGERAAEQVPVGDAATVAVAGHVNGIVGRVDVAQNSSKTTPSNGPRRRSDGDSGRRV